MFARATQLEIDVLRTGMEDVVERFHRESLPALRQRPGYLGILVLTTDEGKGLLVSLWESEESAAAETEFYEAEVAKYVTLFRAVPGREAYEVTIADRIAVTGDPLSLNG